MTVIAQPSLSLTHKYFELDGSQIPAGSDLHQICDGYGFARMAGESGSSESARGMLEVGGMLTEEGS